MISRRHFLGLVAAAAPVLALASPWKWSRRLGVQLYTVRHLAEKDLRGTLTRLRKIGFDDVELYWSVYQLPAARLRRLLDTAGLKAPSGHFDYQGLAGKWDYAAELGLKHVVCPILPDELRASRESYLKAAEQLNAYGSEAKKRGLTFSYHHHNYEFRRFGDQTGFDLLMENTDPALVKIQMDCYWIAQAGLDPVTVMSQYGSRIRMLHLKDRKPGAPATYELNKAAEHFIEAGRGSLDWKAILAKAREVAVEHLFVEQDEGDRPPLESLRISHDYLRRLL